MSKCTVCSSLATKDNAMIKCHVPACKKYFHERCAMIAIIDDIEIIYCKEHYDMYLHNKEERSSNSARENEYVNKNIRGKNHLNVDLEDYDNDASNHTVVDPPSEKLTSSTPEKEEPLRSETVQSPKDEENNKRQQGNKSFANVVKDTVSSFFGGNSKDNADKDGQNSDKNRQNSRDALRQNSNFNKNQPNYSKGRSQHDEFHQFKARKQRNSDSDSESTLNCHECNREIKREPYKCRICFINVHRVCIPSSQAWSISTHKRKFNCFHCQRILNDEKRAKNKEDYRNRESNRFRNCNDQARHSHGSSGNDSREEFNHSLNASKYNFIFNGKSFPMSEQLFFTERKLYYKLPIVTDLERSWRLFYTAYQQSKNYYDDSGNVLRIANAIQCQEVLDIGGDNLFEVDYYDETVELINKRGRGTTDLAIKLCNNIRDSEKPNNDDDKAILKLLDLIQNFYKVIKRENMYNYLHDPNLCVELILKMPRRTSNFLSTKRREALERGDPFYISAIMPTLENLLSDTKHKMEMMRMIESSKPHKKKSDRIFTLINTNEPDNSSDSSDYDNERVTSIAPVKDNRSCWLHTRSNSHTANKCSTLWSMSGEDASKAAQKAGRCTTCGLQKHFNEICPYAKGLKCNISTCKEAHHAMFCKKRPAKEKKRIMLAAEEIDQEYLNECNSWNCDAEEISEVRVNAGNEENKTFDDDIFYFRTNHVITELHPGRNNTVKSNVLTERVEKSVNLKKNEIKKLENNSKNYANVVTSSIFTTRSKTTFNSSSHQLPVVVSNIKTSQGDIRGVFLLDSGSTTSLIERSFANKIFAKGIKHSLSIKGINSQKDDDRSRIIKLPLTRIDDTTKISHVYFHTFEDLCISKQIFEPTEYLKRYKYLKSLNLHAYNNIDGLIGIDNIKIFKWNIINTHSNLENIPIGISTIIGDTIIACETPLESIYENHLSECDDKDLFVNQTHSRINTIRSVNAINELQNEISNLQNQNELTLDDYEEEFNKWEEIIFMQENEAFIQDDTTNFLQDRANKLLKRHVRRLPNSCHFEAPILWKEDEVKLPTNESYKVALRFLIMERNGKKKMEFQEYEREMSKLLDKGYASKLTQSEIEKTTDKTYYVPIFFIKPENKRLRFIWDFKSKCNGKSYNDYVLSGPNLYSKIENILLLARNDKYLIKGDIESMFHQVHLLESDKDSMRFLFRFNHEKQIGTYRMNVLPFGAACSPILSLYVKNIIAEEIKDINPLAHDTLTNYTYVDDTLRALPDIETTVKLVEDMKKYLKLGGFNLLKLNSNNTSIIKRLKHSFANDFHEKLFTDETEEKILGYTFNFNDDSLSVCFDIKLLPKNTLAKLENPTKRTVLQVTNSFYDPLGLYGFITSKMKIIYRRVCQEVKNWDDPIPNELVTTWLRNLKYYDEAKNIKIPRMYTEIESDFLYLVTFCDAGKEMICAVSYVVAINQKSQENDIRLLKSKTITVNNRRSYSIPELELEAAAQATKLASKIKEKLKTKFDSSLFFTDSSIVLQQLNREKKNKLSIYSENRIKTILETSSNNEWHWIPSHLQAADLGTKLESMTNMDYNNKWFTPDILKMKFTDWTQFKLPLSINHISQNQNPQPMNEIANTDTYKSFTSLINSTAKALIWKYKFDSSYIPLKKEIQSTKSDKNMTERAKRHYLKDIESKIKEIEEFIKDDKHWYQLAEAFWLRTAQEQDYEINEIRNILKTGKSVKKSHAYYSLAPYMDHDGLVRLNTRINPNPETLNLIDYDRARPILLPKSHGITTLIILDSHKLHAHCYLKTVINDIKSRFFIRHINNTVKKLIKEKCHYCIRHTTKLLKPIMGDAPKERFAVYEPPFSYIVIDAFGPIFVKPSKYSKNEIKRWVLLSICMSTRATHMEILQDLTTESILEALEILFSIRGTAKEIYSGLAPSFLSANKALIDITNEWNKRLMSQGIIRTHILWKNKAAYSPWFQGAAERMIGETKRLMKNFSRMMNINKDQMTDFTLRHILMKVINIINNSPIAIIEENCQLNNLTPSHFLLMRENTQSHPLTNIETDDLCKCWKGHLNIIKTFWEEWLKCYFGKIIHREKWHNKCENLMIGDFVLVAEKGFVDSWKIGRIEEIDEGSQDQVRSVRVRLGKSKIIENTKILKDKKELLETYKKEKSIVISRPTRLIAKIKLQERDCGDIIKKLKENNLQKRFKIR